MDENRLAEEKRLCSPHSRTSLPDPIEEETKCCPHVRTRSREVLYAPIYLLVAVQDTFNEPPENRHDVLLLRLLGHDPPGIIQRGGGFRVFCHGFSWALMTQGYIHR